MNVKKLIFLAFCLVSIFVVSACGLLNDTNKELKVASGLRVNLLTEPRESLITDRAPKFSWIVPLMQNGDMQGAYRIIVASTLKNLDAENGDLWDSGKVESSQSLHVQYAGKPLSPDSSYYWRVMVWNDKGQSEGWSASQQFLTGKFDKPRAWKGQSDWVKMPDGKWSFENRPPVVYHNQQAVLKKDFGDFIFFDFGKSAFSSLKLTFDKSDAVNKKIKVRLAEHSLDGKIDRKPSGFVIFREYDLQLEDGKTEYFLQIPRFVPHYPHSQPMPAHMPEVLPFRYCEVEGAKPISAVQMRLHIYFNDNLSYFKSSNDILNQVYELCKHSVKINTFNGDYASSERERMMYESDTYIHQMGHYACDAEYAIGRYSVENMIYHATWPTEWIPHSIFMAYADWIYTGDNSSLKSHYDAIKPKTLIDLTTDRGLISTRTGLMTPQFLKSINYNGKKLTDIVDWPQGAMSPALPKCGETDYHEFMCYNTVVNAFHYRALVLMAEIAKAIGKTEDATFYKERAQSFKKIFNKNFFNVSKGRYIDGLDENGKASQHSSIHSNLFPLAFGLVENDALKSVGDFIKSRDMACGVYSANYLIEGLYDNGLAEHAFKLLTSQSDRSWYNMIRIGSTVTIESWDNKYKINNSWTHGWSASPAHLIPRKIMGIDALSADFGKILIKPNPQGLTWAKCAMPTIRGVVKVDFKLAQNGDGHDVYDISIPANSTAELRLPLKKSTVKPLVNGNPVDFKIEDNRVVFTVLSGTWNITL